MGKPIYKMLMELPVDTVLTDLDTDIQASLQVVSTLYPCNQALGTVDVGSQKLIYAVIRTNSADPLDLINALIVAYDLDPGWEPLAFESARATIPVIDAETGEPTGEMVAEQYMPFNPRAQEFYPVRYELDEEGNNTDIIIPFNTSWIAGYSGLTKFITD